MQFQPGNCAKVLAKVDGSGAKGLPVDLSTFGFTQDANQEYFNRALHYGYSVPSQRFQDKGFLPGVPDFVLNNASAALRECEQFDHCFRPLQPLASDGMQVQNSEMNNAHCSRPSNASSCVDHVEEITSHNTDGYDDRAISFGSSCSTGITCYPYSSPMQSDNRIADMQDGTWAALMQMQDALEAPNEECSDLTFNNTELSGGNTMQHQVLWDNSCLASPSFTSNFLPFPGEAETTVTNTSAMYNLQYSVDRRYDNDQDISSFELKVAEQKEATTSHVCEHRDETHSAERRGNPGNDESFDLTITQERQFSSFGNCADGSVDSGINLYDCEEQMEIDSLLNSFGASSDTFPQTYEILQKGENIVDLGKKAKLAESISATFITNTFPYTTQAGATESVVSDGSSWAQQYQSTSQSCGLSYSSASQWETMPGTVFPLGGCQNDVTGSSSMTSLGKNGDLLLSFGHTSMQQQQSVSTDTNLELIDNVANPYQEFVMGVDGQFCSKRTHLYRDETRATHGVWAAHPDMMINFSADTGHSDVQLPMTHTTTVPLPTTSLSKGPDSLFKVDQHHSGMQMPLTQTTVHLPPPCFSKDPNSSFIGTELKKVDQHHSDMQPPLAQASHVQLPAMIFSEYPNLSCVGGTKLKEVDKHDSYMQLPMTQASHVPLPVMSLSQDPKSSIIEGTDLKEIDKHDSDMHLPKTQASHVLLSAVSLSEEPKSSLIAGAELKEVDKHDSDMQLPMAQAGHVPLPAMSLSEDTKSTFIGATELKEVDKHDSHMQLPMAQASHVPLPDMSLSEDPKSSIIEGTDLKEVDKHYSDMQLPKIQASHVLLSAVSLSEELKSALIAGAELKEVDKHDSDMQLPMAQASHVPLPAMSLSEVTKSSFVRRTELKEVDKHDSHMQLSMTQASHVPLPSISLSEDLNSSFIGGTELKEVGKHDSDMQLLIAQTVRVQVPAPSLFKNPDYAFVGKTEVKKVDQLDYSHIRCPQQSVLLSASKPSRPSGLPVIKFYNEVGSQSKKRKRSAKDVLAPHAQAMFGGGRMQCGRTTELDWADAILMEKVDGEKAMMENSTFVSEARRRLTLTTSLIQCVIPVPPARLLAAKITDSGETLVYHICKMVLSDVPDPVQSSVGGTNNFMQSENMLPNKTSTSGKEDCKTISKVLETFEARLGGLESSLSRVDKTLTFQDYASELQQMDQWSITHRFIKLSEYRRVHTGDGSGSKRHPCIAAVQMHPGGSWAPVSQLKRVRCRLLK